MDARTFDRWTTEAARRPTRRSALGLLVGGILAGFASQRGGSPTRAAQIDLVDPPSASLLCTAQGLTDCGGFCVDLLADPYNCGGCGAVCGAGLSCIGAVCLAPAPSSAQTCAVQGLDDCGGVCVDLTADSANCGACGRVCAAGDTCSGGACVTGAVDAIELDDVGVCAVQGLTDCGGFCTNTVNDANNCGVCGNSCPLGSYCEGGVCAGGDPCSGLTNCSGVCVNPNFDAYHCGACGNVCPFPTACCYGRCVDLSSDANHCGRCEFACFAGTSCVNGTCL
jgi:hypothetical protein